ncbi:hypothetical protein SDC9_112396 [bioreactor metagenome]|uniref:Uncharacterized protein n=1 Tax=bioreactor metagenome TaxID=1076179 RepID=A0A645BJ54_9ZZZZ
MHDPVFQADFVEITVQVENPVNGADKMTHIVVCMEPD